MGRHDSSSEEDERVRRRDRRRRERSPDVMRSRIETEDVSRRPRVSDDEDHKSSRRDLEIGAGFVDVERRRGDNKVRKETSSDDEELARRREAGSGYDDDRGKGIEVYSDADGERRVVSKGRIKDRVRADTSSDEDSGKHLSKDTEDGRNTRRGLEDEDADVRRSRKRSPRVMEKQGRERSHRGSRVLADKPSDEEDDRQRSRRGRGERSERKHRDHRASDDDEEGEIRSERRGKEKIDRGNEGLLKRDRRDRDLNDGHENGSRRREIERRGRSRRDDERDRRHNDRYDNSQRDKVRKEDSSKREEKIEVPKPKLAELNPSESNAMALGKTGGVYIPPFKLARMMKEVEDKSSVEYQRLTWDALRKSINGLVNKVNASNIKNIIPELFAENLIRGRGLFCRSCMKSQMASPGFTDVFAALVAVINAKFPEVAELLLKRVVLQLKRAYKRNDKPQLLAAVKFIAHLVNQQVAEEIIALELLTLLLEYPTDDSVEVAVGFVTDCGAMLQDVTPKGLHGIFERFRGILHEGEIDKRVQYLIESLYATRKANFQGHPAVRPELDLVEEKYSHDISLSQEINPETALDVFKPDPDFVENEKKYEALKKELLGEEESEDEDGSDASSEDNDEEEDDSDEEDEEQMRIRDETETNLVNLRRTIYLTIMSSVDFEEAGHKLLKIKLEPGQEMELCIMLLECCSQERTYLRYYGLLGQRFCMINKIHQENFEKCFVQQYSMIHRLETNKLRNVAKFFAHLLGTDALPWHVLAYIRLTEEDTTSSSRIFIKILFQELSEHLGIRLLNERLQDPTMQESLESIFPKDNPKNTRFAINFFTSIGLGGITENLREYLKNMPRLIMQQQKQVAESESGSSSGSDSSGSDSESESESSSSSSSDESDREKRKRRRRA
ncbi:PREDICTED: pre-mRNA-splicing factor CWC22 homolog [Camelina sativa]|uniref:Pre-mRNA-splicing factor CWC22 homolog n=1 Tax=Camelina sativa TaxID=90675 RepID=A0ABM0WLM2_CAMSA|nr:PREDICTED: pre-mRNA-splicing factor CWC22 homolog [Camelina sativa]